MNSKNLVNTALLLSGLAMSANAISADGTLNITGTVYVTACTINSGVTDISLTIPTSFVADYTDVGTTGPLSDSSQGSLSLTNCPASDMAVAVTVAGDADDINPDLFKVTSGTATGVGLKLTFDGDNVLPNSSTTYYTVEDLGSGNYGWTKFFQVSPVSTEETVKAGTLDTSLTYTLAYK